MKEKMEQLAAKLSENQALAEKLAELENPEDVQSLLKEEGIDFSVEEINELRDALLKTVEKDVDDELSEDDLEEVAGGAIALATVGTIATIVGSTAGTANLTHNVTRGRW